MRKRDPSSLRANFCCNADRPLPPLERPLDFYVWGTWLTFLWLNNAAVFILDLLCLPTFSAFLAPLALFLFLFLPILIKSLWEGHTTTCVNVSRPTRVFFSVTYFLPFCHTLHYVICWSWLWRRHQMHMIWSVILSKTLYGANSDHEMFLEFCRGYAVCTSTSIVPLQLGSCRLLQAGRHYSWGEQGLCGMCDCNGESRRGRPVECRIQSVSLTIPGWMSLHPYARGGFLFR